MTELELCALDVDVDGAALLDELCRALRHFVVVPDPMAVDAVALWIVATHAIDAFDSAPRLIIRSPVKGSGKSRLLDIIAGTCARPLLCSDTTAAVIFRAISETSPPTLLMDEADALWATKMAAERNEQLRALVNAGFTPHRPVLRCVGPTQKLTAFPSFAMVAMCGLATDVPDTIMSRSIIVTMRRRLPTERYAPFRESRDGPALHQLRDRLSGWIVPQLADLAKADPELPVVDRAADVWAPLVTVADAAGGDWPGRARAAAVHFTAIGVDDDAESLAVRLLTDIRDVWPGPTVDFLSSRDIVAKLRGVEDGPWGFDEHDLTVRRLANRLRPLGIRPGSDGSVRGYKREAFADAIARYLTP